LIRECRPDVVHCVMEPWSVTCLQTLATLPLLERRPKFGVQACETKLDQGGPATRTIRRRLYARVVARCDYFVGWTDPVWRAGAGAGLNGQPTATAAAVGVDTALFRPPARDEKTAIRHELSLGSASDFLVGFVGRFVEEKGVDDLVAAADSAAA